MTQKTKTQQFIDNTPYEAVYQFYIVENHSKQQCWEHFQTTERIFRAYLTHHNLAKPPNLRHKRASHTKLLRYDDPYFNNREKCTQTCLGRFGADSPLACGEIWQKTYDTKVASYGGTGFAAADKARRIEVAKIGNKALWEKYYTDKEFRDRYQTAQNNTKRAHASFKSSKQEKYLYLKLCEEYGVEDVITQYQDDRYPFNCDFYIKSLDLFIELNLHPTHGPHPFNTADSFDLALLEQLKERAKTSDFYKNILHTWTVRDQEKLEYLKKNKLRYVLIYPKQEVYSYGVYKSTTGCLWTTAD